MKKQVRRFVYLLLSLMFLATTVLGLAGPAAAGIVPLQNLSPGNTVSFAGYKWIVLDPSSGYLLMKGSYGQDQLFDSNSNLSLATFDPQSSTNIAYSLNHTFYNSLPSSDQALIVSHNWTNADETEDTNTSSTVTCKIGLISYSEYKNYTNNGSDFDIISNLTDFWWTRTPYSANFTDVWEVNGSGMGYVPADGFDFGPLAVRPALYLESGLTVSGGIVSNETFSLPGNVRVTGVTLNKSSDEIIVGDTDQLTATVAPSNAVNTAVTWKSSNTSVATVDQTGLVTAVKTAAAGDTAIITVTTADGGFTATCEVEDAVAYIVVSGVTLSKSTDTINVGATDQLTATVSPPNANDKKVAWSSDNTSAAIVDNTGLVTGVAPGSANIMVITDDENYYQKCAVTVTAPMLSGLGKPILGHILNPFLNPVSVTGVILNKTSDTINTGATDQLTATVAPTNATNQAVTWASSNTSVATVNSSGQVTGVAAGTANITATTSDGSFTATCAVTVTAATIPGAAVSVTGVTLNKTSDTIDVGATDQLTATVAPTNATNQAVTWGSSNTGAATVSSSGLVTGVAAGTANITATTSDGSFIATCAVTVTAATIPGSGTSSSPATQTVLQFHIGSTDYSVNGQVQSMDTAPMISEGRTLLPIRYVATPLGAIVSWDQAQQMVTVTLGSKTIQLVIGQGSATVNGATVPIDPANPDVTAVIIPPGRTMLPMRFVAENLGCQVNWNAAQQIVTVTYPST